jgi:hypothetical protein
MFPCGATLIGLAVSVELDREVCATTVGAEGVVGSIIRRPSPAYSRAKVHWERRAVTNPQA